MIHKDDFAVNDTVSNARRYCELLDLNTEFQWVVDNNPANDLPYHNLFHTCTVIERCFDGAQFYNLPYSSIHQLLLSAMFHDYDHTGGKQNDEVNIHNAITGYEEFVFSHQGRLSAEHVVHHNVIQIIRTTQYPFIRPPVSVEQKIIRDADLMMITYPNWYSYVIEGLMQEAQNRDPSITIPQAIEKQIAFFETAMMFTDWGRSVFDHRKRVVVDQLRRIKDN